jgi:hypothetical protein
MTNSEDDSTRQETPHQPLDVTTDHPSEDTQGPNNDSHKPPSDDVVDRKSSTGSPNFDDSVLDSCTSESSSPGSSTDDAASETSESGLSEDDHNTKATGPKISITHSDKTPDTEENTSDDGNLADVSILTDAESPGMTQNATEEDVQKPSEDIDAVSDAVPNNYVSKSSQTDDDPEFNKEGDNVVEENNHPEDNEVPTTDQTSEPSEAGDVPEVGNNLENDNVCNCESCNAQKADNATPVDRTPEPSEAGDAPEVYNDPDADNDETANKTPEPSEAGDTPAEERCEDSDITKRLRKMDDKSPSRKKWILRKEKFGKDNEALDELMLKYGLEEVKAHFLWVYDQRQRARGRDDVLWDLTNMHTCFLEGGENSMYTGSVLLPAWPRD